MFKRGVAVYSALCILFSFILYRIISLNSSPYAKTDSAYSSKTLLVGETRGNIYDISLNKLVNGKEKLICVAKSGAYSLEYVSKNLSGETGENIISQLTKGYPVTFETKERVQNDDMETFAVPIRYADDGFLCHVIGYTDSSGTGVSGIEKAYNSFLSEGGGTLSVTFETDANGKVLSGIVPTVNDNNYFSESGVILTIDENIQRIAEKAMNESSIESGACVVLSAQDAGISAVVSTPTFVQSDIEGALKGQNSPLVNKAFSSYAVGSVFKPIIACAALENGVETDFDYVCTGETEINGTKYGCNRKTAHGNTDLKAALEVSCNTYFVNLTKALDAGTIYDFCVNMGFSCENYFCEGMYADKGCLPEENELNDKCVKANLSFGQGELTATPVQMAAAYLAIANNGYYKYPYLIKGTLESNGTINETERKPDSKVISEKCCKVIRDDLISVVENGNAYNAECSLCTVAGKTGTAQSGIYDENGKEILRTWFVGFFPARDPLYCVAILNENGTSGAGDCAPVFSVIAENTMQYLIEKAK